MAASNPLRLVVVGREEWVTLGTSDEGFEVVGAIPEIVASGFALRTDDGAAVVVPEGVRIRVGSLPAVRRRGLPYRDAEGTIRTRFTFEVRAESSIYADASWVTRALAPYRAGPVRVRRADRMVLAGTAEELDDPRLQWGRIPWGLLLFVGFVFLVVVVAAIFST